MTSINTDFVPVKCGIRLNPPALVVIYKNTEEKLRKRMMPLRNFRPNSSVSFIAQDLKQRHNQRLQNVSTLQIEKMLRVIQEHLKGVELNKAVESVNAEFTIGSNEDLNKLGSDEVQRKKHIMDETFNKNCIKPGDAGFIYDKRVDFDSNAPEKLESEWDSEEKDDFWN